MTLKLSTCLRNKLTGLQATPKAILTEALSGGAMAYVDNVGEPDSITDAGSAFITAGFSINDLIYTYDSTTAANDLSGVALITVVAGTVTVVTGTVNTAEGFDTGTVMVSCTGGSLKDVFQDSVLRLYSGSAPSTADAVVSGTEICKITVSSGAFVAGAFANGLEFGAAALGVIAKNSEVWSGIGINGGGTAGYFRLNANATDTGVVDTTYVYPRIQGTIGTSGADLNMSSTTITTGATYTIDTFSLTLPEYYGA